jgi:hypothetical protein
MTQSNLEALDDIIEYLDDRADVDAGQPNTAMKLLGTAKELRESLSNLDERNKKLIAANTALLAFLEEVTGALNDTRIVMRSPAVSELAGNIVERAISFIALSKLPDIDPVTGLPFNKD